jgi:hypothetical protein
MTMAVGKRYATGSLGPLEAQTSSSRATVAGTTPKVTG